MVLAAVYFLTRGPTSSTETGPKPGPAIRVTREPTSMPVPGKTSDPEAGATLSPQLEKEIENAVVTYSPAGLPTFEKLLASGEPDIREAARDGLVRLGEKGGARLLRAATARLTEPEEIKRFQDTADYLELPSASEGPLKPGASE